MDRITYIFVVCPKWKWFCQFGNCKSTPTPERKFWQISRFLAVLTRRNVYFFSDVYMMDNCNDHSDCYY